MYLAAAIALLAQSIALEAVPDKVQLGPGAHATLRIRAPAGSAPSLAASAGKVGAVAETAPGVFEADYRPPDTSVPQIVFVTADAGTAGTAWLPLQLWGSADALLKGKPRSFVDVVIGTNRFGPIRLDEKGTALVAVVVPPGISEAHSGKRVIPFGVPPVPTLFVSVPPGPLVADAERRVPLRIFATSPQGAPVPEAKFVFAPERGPVSDPESAGPGQFHAVWTVPPGAPGVVRLTAALATAPQQRVRAQIRLEAGLAKTIELVAQRTVVTAGEEPLDLRAVARDAAGNSSPEPLRFEASFGEAGAARGENGAWDVRVRIPPRLEGRRELRVVAHPEGRDEPRAAAEVQLAPGPPAEVVLAASPRVRADGENGIPVRLAVRDRYGNPVPAATPAVSADTGTLEQVARESDGAWTATYRPPLLRERSTAALVAHAGPASTAARIDLLPQIHALALSPKLGFTGAFSDVTSPVFAVEAAWRSERFGPRLEALAELAYAYSSVSSPTASGTSIVAVKSHTDFFTVTLAAGWLLPVGDRSQVWVHAGPTFTRVATALKIGGQPTAMDATVVPGAQLSIGAERRVSGTIPFLELRVSTTADPALGTLLSGSWRAFSLSGGVRFELL